MVVPAAWLSLLTGLLESWLTTWGFFKYRWVIVKQNPVYLHDCLLYTVTGMMFIGALTLLSLISTLKPWTKIDRANMKREQARLPEIE